MNKHKQGSPSKSLSSKHSKQQAGDQQKKGTHGTTKKENILNLSRMLNKEIHVELTGGRQVWGTLIGHDTLNNLVLENVRECFADGSERFLGKGTGRGEAARVVIRGPMIATIESFIVNHGPDGPLFGQ